MDPDDDMPHDAIDAVASVGDRYSGDEEEEEINTDDQEDYNYYSYHDNICDDDDWHDVAADSIVGDAASSSRPQEKNYTILKEEDIRQRQEEDITEIFNVLQISKEAACLILLGYNWSVSKVLEEWFADEERVRNAVGIIMETPKVKFPGNKKFNCGICFDKYTCKHLHCAGCGHLFCNSCWESYISTAIDDGPGCLTLRCPDPSCSAAVGPTMIDKFATDKDKAKYHNFICRSYVENSSKIKWCPAPGCDYAVEFVTDSESYDVVCGCWYEFCWNCKEEAHRPVDCDTVAKWILKNSAESESINWILVKTKPCPKCKRPIEKNQGCNHMACSPPCSFRFCWLCLGALSDHGKRSGGSNSCNGYEEPKQAGVNDDSEKNRNKAKAYLEKYTHYYERWASNNSSRRKALKDLSEMQNVHIQKLSDVQCQTEIQLKFILEAWKQIVECRRVLKWTYAYGYYLSEPKNEQKTTFFEYLQGEAESGLERLHYCAEEELMNYIKSDKPSDDFNNFRTKLTSLTSVTRNYFANLVRALENGLSDVINSKVGKREAQKTEGSCHKRSKPF